jgi:clan AA aspartic protease (TIGR02281 family)
MRPAIIFSNLLVLCSLVLSPAFAATSGSTDTAEAELFFNQIIKSTDNPVIANLAQENLSKLKKQQISYLGQPRTVEIPLLTQLNNSLAVPVLMNQKVMATFIVDTGATYTVITPRMAKKLGIVITPDTPRITIATANGAITAPKVTVPKLAIGGLEVENVEVIVQNLGDDLLLSGLLGMNFFKNMDLTIRQDKLIVHLNAV